MAQETLNPPQHAMMPLNTRPEATERGDTAHDLINKLNAMLTELYGGASFTPSRQIIVPLAGRAKLGGSGAGWVIDGDNALPLVTLPASQTSEVLLVPIEGLEVGDIVTAVGVNGQVESAGGNVTLALDVRKVTTAAADITDASIGTDNVGTLTADTILSDANLGVTGLTETMAANESLYVTLTGTTAASTDIALQSLTVTVTRSPLVASA
jgi:hypothetical protein